MILLILLLTVPLTLCLRITQVYVPNLADVRGRAELRCIYELGPSRLNSVKWYKDESEFYRYAPLNYPDIISTFSVVGANVLEEASNGTVVTLEPLEYASTGSYLCEVSTEAPHFNLDRKSATMTVLGIPKHEPVIDGVRSAYNIGDYVTANCTTAESRPAPTVQWLINGQQASEWLQEQYKREVPLNTHELEAKTVGLRFQLSPEHFQKTHQLVLTCVAQVEGIVKKSVVHIYPAPNNGIYAQERSHGTILRLSDTSLPTIKFLSFVFLINTM